ncbi:MAG TPA: hypothetical protein EYP19_17215, partial [Desulfobacterales bacterium]|nr:hypothetical protein [Desulfobacterales bacterium]
MARFVTIICTRCGKTNEVSYTGHRIKIRCVGCGHSVTVGGRAAGLKSLPLQEIGIAIGILFLIGLGFAVYSFFIVERDPLQEHREKVREAAKAVVLAAKAPEWHDVSFRYVVTVFNDF